MRRILTMFRGEVNRAGPIMETASLDYVTEAPEKKKRKKRKVKK